MPDSPREVTLDIGLDEPTDTDHLRARLAHVLRLPVDALPAAVLRKRSLDARRGKVRFHFLFEIGATVDAHELAAPHPRAVGARRVVIVGDGPAGLFCAYALARRGVGCLVIDRGKPVQPRRRDLASLSRDGLVDPNSNYCFGEGGAGTYSDGKLYTRAHKRGSTRDVIEILVRHGAPESILVDARPHIGSNRLPKVVTSLRAELERVGVEFTFGARVVELVLRGAVTKRVVGVKLENGAIIDAEAVVLATGHSAADIYEMLIAQGIRLEAKAFAVGVRIEHPQPLINRIQYGAAAAHPALPAAAYRLAETIEGRGVFSFCMCPGGFIVPASTEPGGLVVNGMSLSRRDSPFANSGIVVAVEPADLEAQGYRGALGGIEFQRRVEQAAFQAGGGMLRAPATRATDFAQGRGSSTVPMSSYVPGLSATNLSAVLDAGGLGLARRIQAALLRFDRIMRGYLTDEAVLVGVESRTSSPVRIPRHPESLECLDCAALYPAGEGGGHAGGIMSAAMDGLRVAEQLIAATRG